MDSQVAFSIFVFLVSPGFLTIGGDVGVSTPQEDIAEPYSNSSSSIMIHAGKDLAIRCESGAAEGAGVTCLWLWEYPDRSGAPTVIAGFPGHGGAGTDCSINLVNVSSIQTGWWTCRAQLANSTIVRMKPVFLQVTSSPLITFVTKPVNRTYSLGLTAELECKTDVDVKSCRWKFQQEGQADSLVVREGPPENANDCSFKLEHISYEQIGLWTCGARSDDSDGFSYTDTVYIQVENKEEAVPIEFDEEPSDSEVRLGESIQLACKVRVDAHIEACRWYWQPVGHTKAWRVLMREFLPVNNDCSVEFTNVTTDPEGLWTCHVKPIHSKTFKPTGSAKLTVVGEAKTSSLARDVSIVEGEELTILCIAQERAKTCQWKRKPFQEVTTDTTDMLDTFIPSGSESRDCSLHLDHVKLEHTGLWICSIQFMENEKFLDAMPTAVSVKAAENVRFVDVTRAQLAAENKPVRLNCSTQTVVRECIWSWYEEAEDAKVVERVVRYNFTSKNGYDCSVEIPSVGKELQGIWQCMVKYGNPDHPNTAFGRPFSLTVVTAGPVTFRTTPASTDILVGSSISLECTVASPADECLWLLYEGKLTSKVQPVHYKRFHPFDFNNCSLRLTSEDRSGWYSCGVRNPGSEDFTLSRLAQVTIIQPGNISTKNQISSDGLLTLICQMSVAVKRSSCDWIHPGRFNVVKLNQSDKYEVEYSIRSGMCSVKFRPILFDVGSWKCVYSVNNKSTVLGQATFTVLSSPLNVRLSWVVGVLATVSLLLTVMLFVVISCKFYPCGRSSNTVQLNKPLAESNKRYSEDPTKGINFSFNESPELLVDFAAPNEDNHHYEHVGRYGSHRPSFYQNVN